ncbi:TIGR00282 family metallophosphoesterase [soil metagenome]
MNIRILFIGDVVGAPGRAMLQKHINRLREQYAIDATIVNGENSADGKGVTPRIMEYFKHLKVNVVTSGNHIWDKRDIIPYMHEHDDLLRPANFPAGVPGIGIKLITVKDNPVAVINMQGRIFMKEHIDCPFRAIDSLLAYLKDKTSTILVDFHAETTAEKACFAYYLDGRVSAVVGTHTHVQTADERVLPKGTAFITDLGMVGALDSSLGMKKEPIIQQFMNQMPTRYTVETEGPMLLSGVWMEIDTTTGAAVKIERIRLVDDQIQVDEKE